MPTVTPTTVVARRPEAITRAAGDTLLMLDPRRDSYFELDPVGRRIWELLEEPQPVEALCSALVTEFAVPAETCRADVLAFLEELAAAELVTIG